MVLCRLLRSSTSTGHQNLERQYEKMAEGASVLKTSSKEMAYLRISTLTQPLRHHLTPTPLLTSASIQLV